MEDMPVMATIASATHSAPNAPPSCTASGRLRIAVMRLTIGVYVIAFTILALLSRR